MAVADVGAGVKLRFQRSLHRKFGFAGLFCLLSAFTLCTLDGGEVAPLIISAVLFLLCALYVLFAARERFRPTVPIVCLTLMACYGIAQTLWFPQKIVYNGWTGVLFWSTAATICFLATQIFQDPAIARHFRLWFVVFGSAVCVLDLLEQASRTNRYFWLIQSKYATVSGPFAYWNNFAQFVELFLPITLWLAVGGQRLAPGFLLLGGLQIAAVIASGSRAGTALVILETASILVIAHLRNRKRNSRFLYATAAIVLTIAFFGYAAGFETLSRKLEQRDQLAVRRDINKSSLAMIRERPLTGWGLGTYVPVYRMFARYDDGSYVNRAHNDWLEWTAEGGILFSSLMLIVFLWSVKPGFRSVWGIGLIAICLHAVVDYPFARFGVCGWYFALLGMLAAAPSTERKRYSRPPEREAYR